MSGKTNGERFDHARTHASRWSAVNGHAVANTLLAGADLTGIAVDTKFLLDSSQSLGMHFLEGGIDAALAVGLLALVWRVASSSDRHRRNHARTSRRLTAERKASASSTTTYQETVHHLGPLSWRVGRTDTSGKGPRPTRKGR